MKSNACFEWYDMLVLEPNSGVLGTFSFTGFMPFRMWYYVAPVSCQMLSRSQISGDAE